ncbi:hypothetical protein PMAYCL1PPCAC_08028, partial [Pristionchus mayeri]
TITRKEILPDRTAIYQTHDGTVFYYKFTSPHRLYVRLDGKDIEGQLPDGELSCKGTRGNSVFFEVNDKEVYRAVFSQADGITVSYECEKYKRQDLRASCVRYRDGEKRVYRMSDEPTGMNAVDGVDQPRLIAFHRGVDIYISQMPDKKGLTALNIRTNVAVVEASDIRIVKHYTRDWNAMLIYFAQGSELYALNAETMKFLPPLHIDDIDYIAAIVRIHEGEITMNCHSDGHCYLMTAKLPADYTLSSAVECLVVCECAYQLKCSQSKLLHRMLHVLYNR